MRDAMFLVLSSLVGMLALFCVTTRHVLRSAVFLMAVLSLTAGLYILLESELLAGIQILVYVGGIVVLLVFAIMMTETENIEHDSSTFRRKLFGLLVAAGFFWLNVFFALSGAPDGLKQNNVPMQNEAARFGRAFLDTGSDGYVFPFEIISLLLLAVLIGGIVIARKPETGGKTVC